MKAKRALGLSAGRHSLLWILYGGMAVLLLLMQTAPRFFPVIGAARPTPLVLFAICVAFFEGPQIGAIVGVAVGLLWDLYSFRLFGINAMILLVITVVVGLLVQWLLRANFLSGMLMCVGGVLVYTLAEWLLCYALFLYEEAGTVLWNVYLPNALYTIVLSPIMYWCVLGVARFLRRQRKR